MNGCFLKASTFGNVSILQYLFWTMPLYVYYLFEANIFQKMLLAAARNDHAEVIKFLLFDLSPYKKAEVSNSYTVIFTEAAVNGSFATMDLLLGPDPFGQLLAPQLDNWIAVDLILEGIALNGRVDSLEHLLEWSTGQCGNGPRMPTLPTSIARKIPISNACKWGHLNMVQFLLRKDEASGQYLILNMDPINYGLDPLLLACCNGHVEVVKELLRRDAQNNPIHMDMDPAILSDRPLVEAVYHGHLSIIKFLLEDVFKPDDNGQYNLPGINATCLARAVRNNHVDAVTFLLQCNEENQFMHPNINIPVDLIKYAVQLGSVEFLRTLLTLPFVHRNEMLHRALKRAVRQKDPQRIKLILSGLYDSEADFDPEAVPIQHINYLIDYHMTPCLLSDLLRFRTMNLWQRRCFLQLVKHTLLFNPLTKVVGAMVLGTTVGLSVSFLPTSLIRCIVYCVLFWLIACSIGPIRL